MNLGVICDINNEKPECVIVHNYENGDIGYSTYNDKLSVSVNTILNNDIYSQTILNNNMDYSICTKNSPYYISVLNNYLPFPYKLLWIKKINGNIEDVLEQAYEILEMEENNNEEINKKS